MAELPDYCLSRPALPRGAFFDDFERLYAAQVNSAGRRVIDYQLRAPKWQFLCWLADTKPVLLHGSSVGEIAEFEPRLPGDTSEFGGRHAVFATSDGIWALFFAVVERPIARSLVKCLLLHRRSAGTVLLLLGQRRRAQ